MTKWTIALWITMALMAMGCAGRSLVRPQPDTLVLGKTTREEILQRLGDPASTTGMVKNEHAVTAVRYVIPAFMALPPHHPKMDFFFLDAVLVGYRYSSALPSEAAGRGAAMGGFGMLYSGLVLGSGPLWPLGVVAIGLAPVAAAVGAVVGPVKAEDAARVEEAEAVLKAALPRLKPVEMLRDRLIEVARTHTSHSVIPLEDPLDIDDVVTVLELAVSDFQFRGDGAINPPFGLVLRVRARLIRVADGTRVGESTFEAQSPKRKFVEWAENNGRSLDEELNSIVLKLSNDIVARVLVRRLSDESRQYAALATIARPVAAALARRLSATTPCPACGTSRWRR